MDCRNSWLSKLYIKDADGLDMEDPSQEDCYKDIGQGWQLRGHSQGKL